MELQQQPYGITPEEHEELEEELKDILADTVVRALHTPELQDADTFVKVLVERLKNHGFRGITTLRREHHYLIILRPIGYLIDVPFFYTGGKPKFKPKFRDIQISPLNEIAVLKYGLSTQKYPTEREFEYTLGLKHLPDHFLGTPYQFVIWLKKKYKLFKNARFIIKKTAPREGVIYLFAKGMVYVIPFVEGKTVDNIEMVIPKLSEVRAYHINPQNMQLLGLYWNYTYLLIYLHSDKCPKKLQGKVISLLVKYPYNMQYSKLKDLALKIPQIVDCSSEEAVVRSVKEFLEKSLKDYNVSVEEVKYDIAKQRELHAKVIEVFV